MSKLLELVLQLVVEPGDVLLEGEDRLAARSGAPWFFGQGGAPVLVQIWRSFQRSGRSRFGHLRPGSRCTGQSSAG